MFHPWLVLVFVFPLRRPHGRFQPWLVLVVERVGGHARQPGTLHNLGSIQSAVRHEARTRTFATLLRPRRRLCLVDFPLELSRPTTPSSPVSWQSACAGPPPQPSPTRGEGFLGSSSLSECHRCRKQKRAATRRPIRPPTPAFHQPSVRHPESASPGADFPRKSRVLDDGHDGRAEGADCSDYEVGCAENPRCRLANIGHSKQ